MIATTSELKELFRKEKNPRTAARMRAVYLAMVDKSVQLPANVTLVYLSPYSPQLNPIEKLWQYLRKHYWSNRVYTDYDALRVAALEA